MRRTVTAMGSLAAAGALALGVSSPAAAATGQLVFDGQPLINPSGCYSATFLPMITGVLIDNATDEAAVVYSGPNCTGSVEATVPAGAGGIYPGVSIYIP